MGIVVDIIMDKLKLLNYERAFCLEVGVAPLDRCMMLSRMPNSKSQFQHSSLLCHWLLSVCQSTLFLREDVPEDQKKSTAIIVSSALSLGFAGQLSAASIQQGYGDTVCF